jgi:hypothetical protein
MIPRPSPGVMGRADYLPLIVLNARRVSGEFASERV